MLWAAVGALQIGQFNQLRKAFRLFGDGTTVRWSDDPIEFLIVLLLVLGASVFFFVIGWLKFVSRRRRWRAIDQRGLA